MTKPKIISSINEARLAVQNAQRQEKSVGLVPTMGALHAGHLSLVRRSNQFCDFHVVTIFVNPTQFGDGEDLDRYPRTLDRDFELLSEFNVDFVFVPENDDIYPEDYSTFVNPPKVANLLEGEHRADHFRGVTTIVLKLFQILPADHAFFGEKDLQQCMVIEHMVRDLNVPVRIHRCPIIREADGLALSSRNQYLDAQERERALSISRSLRFAEQLVRDGVVQVSEIIAEVRELLMESRVDMIDYIEIVDGQTFRPVSTILDDAVLLIAAHVGTTRLIDNWRLR